MRKIRKELLVSNQPFAAAEMQLINTHYESEFEASGSRWKPAGV